jgi:hypothetical protein
MDLKAHHYSNHQKSLNCFAQLQTMGMIPKSKMWQFYRNVSRAWVELDKEFVLCRRANKLTLKYTEMERTLDESIRVFEQYSLMAALTY